MENETCKPRCNPFKTLEELLNWLPLTCNQSVLNQTSPICLAYDKQAGQDGDGRVNKMTFQFAKNTPKTLVCHDMKGGYLEDCLVEGCSNSKAYSFIQWNLIDIFVYFSHYFITVPPPCWVHAAHIHGVPILGTFITEWDDGALMCQKVFHSKDTVDAMVNRLVAVTFCHNFDGWLINIENEVEKELVGNVVYFLQRLRRELSRRGNKGLVIWYDSITKEGKLDWQNELNDLNRDYFDACDGIFLNYTWTAEHLSRTVAQAGSRILDVFVGVDIFGRNCFGGGGFNTSAALSVVRCEMGLSTAMFAPGWVYEHFPDDFSAQSCKFWSLILPYLSIRGPAASLPFHTSFCPGYGQVEYSKGQVVQNEPWHNGAKQQLQPCLAGLNGLEHSDDDGKEGTKFDVLKWGSHLKFGRQTLCDEDAYNGGACLLLQSQGSAIFPLFTCCDIPAPKDMLLAIAFKAEESSFLDVDLIYEETDSAAITHVTWPIQMECDEKECANRLFKVTLIPEGNHPKHEDVLGGIFRSHSDSWNTRLFRISSNGSSKFLLKAIHLESRNESCCKIGFLGCY